MAAITIDRDRTGTSNRTTTAASPLTVTLASGVAKENGVISGDGILSLGETSTYSGGTIPSVGTLKLYATDALSTGTINVTGGGLRAGEARRVAFHCANFMTKLGSPSPTDRLIRAKKLGWDETRGVRRVS